MTRLAYTDCSDLIADPVINKSFLHLRHQCKLFYSRVVRELPAAIATFY